MDYIKRIGTDRHKFKLEFVMRKLKFSRHLPGKIYLSIQRGEHKMKTENLVEIGANFQCDLKKEIVTFPALTLFYDQTDHKYQSKPGEMKLLLVKDTGDKKLIGKVTFDVAEFANKRTDSVGSSQTEEKMKIKKQVEEIPEKLRMEASIQYSVFVKFIGEASETDKSLKDEKLRSQSPFDKLKNFLFGNEEDNKPKEVESSRRISKPQIASPKKQSKEKPQSKQERGRSRQAAVFEFDQQQQQPKKPSTKQRVNSDYHVPKPSDRDKPKRKKQTQQLRESEGEESQISHQVKSRKKPMKAPRTPSPEANEQSEILQDNKKLPKARQSEQSGSSKQQPSRDLDESRKEKPSKNLVQPKQNETLTQYEGQNRKISNFNKSEEPNTHQNENHEFYFDDPTTFPPNYKKDKTNNVKNQDTSSPQLPKRANKDEKKFKTDREIEKKQNESDQQQPFDELQSKNGLTVPSPNRRVKENSIQISSKDLQKQLQKKKKRQQQNSNKQILDPPSIPKDNKLQRPKSKEGRLPQPAIKKEAQKQQQQIDVNSSQVKNMFISFDEPPMREHKASIINPKKISQNESNIFIKEDLDKKQKDLAEMKQKLEGLQKMERRLREEQGLRETAEKTVAHLKQQNKRLEKDLERVREEYNTLRSEHESQSSIFRATQDHFLNNSEQNDLDEDNKRLEREKNEMIVNMTKQKEKHAREIKAFREELEKERMKYKQLENTSKIDLKKLKDQNLKLSGNVEIMKDKNKEKVRENETLLNENKTLNGQVIELKDKLGALKLKICEKLNEANEHGESQLMEVLTELCQDM